MDESSPTAPSGKKVFFAILFLTVTDRIGFFLRDLAQGGLRIGVFFRPLYATLLLIALWRGQRFARILLAIFFGIETFLFAFEAVRLNDLSLAGVCILPLTDFILLVSFSSLGHFMEFQRTRFKKRASSLAG